MRSNMEYNSISGKKEIPAPWKNYPVRAVSMHPWAKRLNDVLNDRGWTARELSRRSGIDYDSVAKYTQGRVEKPRGQTLDKLAKALDVDRIWLQEGLGRGKEYGVPVAGYVGAGGEISFLDDYPKGDGMDRVAPPPNAPSNAVALIVRGDSMQPALFDGWCLIYWDRREDPSGFVGELCIAETECGMTYVKMLRRGLRKGVFTLESHNAPPVEDVPLKWAARVEAIYTSVLWL